MTRDPYPNELTIEEHRYIDVMVARHIAGLTVVDIPFVPSAVSVVPGVVFTDRASEEWYKAYPHSRVVDRVPFYSSNIFSAWEVAKKTWGESGGLITPEDVLSVIQPTYSIIESAAAISLQVLRLKGVALASVQRKVMV